MPRAHRHFLPGHVWHLTHRCHKKIFLRKSAKDRHYWRYWRYWLFESRKRFGLSVLNYIVTWKKGGQIYLPAMIAQTFCKKPWASHSILTTD